MVEDQDLGGGLFGEVVPFLSRVVGDGTVKVVVGQEAEVHVETVENLVLWLERTGVHHCQWIVHHLLWVQWLPESQHHAQLLLLSVQRPGQSVRLGPVGEAGEGELLIELVSLLVVLVVVEVGSHGPDRVSYLVASPHQVCQPLEPLN